MALAAEPAPILTIFPVALDREHGVEPVRLAEVEIVLAMVGRHMDEPGAAVGGDEIAREEGARTREEAAERVHRMAGDGAGKVGAFAAPHNIVKEDRFAAVGGVLRGEA